MFRVLFYNQSKVYELYARQIFQSDLYGFIEIEELLFGDHGQLLLDTAEEKLKAEFAGVKRSYLPMHAIIRIDEVEQEGPSKISDIKGGNVTTFPLMPGPFGNRS